MVTIFSTPNCQYCIKVKTLLRENEIPYIDILAAFSEEFKVLTTHTGKRTVPLVVDGNWMSQGWDEPALRAHFNI